MGIKSWIIAVCILLVSFLIGSFINKKYVLENIVNSNIEDFSGGEFLQLVYIASESCVYCTDSLSLEVGTVNNKLKEYSKIHGYGYYSTGVSVDLKPQTGFNFINKYETFDEVITGVGWYNNGVRNYIWENFGLEGSVPQILIVRSKIKVHSSDRGITDLNRQDSLIQSFKNLTDLQKFDVNQLELR